MFTARYPGRCASTGAPIRPGDTVRSVARGRYALVSRAAEPADPVDPDLAFAASIDPETAAAEPEAAAAAGRYLRQSMARGVSDIWRSSTGREYYRNRRGLCEDAPCCGLTSAPRQQRPRNYPRPAPGRTGDRRCTSADT
jgi:hypothetical protein